MNPDEITRARQRKLDELEALKERLREIERNHEAQQAQPASRNAKPPRLQQPPKRKW